MEEPPTMDSEPAAAPLETLKEDDEDDDASNGAAHKEDACVALFCEKRAALVKACFCSLSSPLRPLLCRRPTAPSVCLMRGSERVVRCGNPPPSSSRRSRPLIAACCRGLLPR